MNENKERICRRATLEERAKQADCNYCGTARAKNGNFCSRCGKPLKNSEFFNFDSLKD